MSSNDFSASQEVIEPANSIPLSQQSGLEISSRNNFENEPQSFRSMEWTRPLPLSTCQLSHGYRKL